MTEAATLHGHEPHHQQQAEIPVPKAAISVDPYQVRFAMEMIRGMNGLLDRKDKAVIGLITPHCGCAEKVASLPCILPHCLAITDQHCFFSPHPFAG
jgi:hypothetical protein